MRNREEKEMSGHDDYYCTECGKMLYLANIVWLELDQRTNTYTSNVVPNEYSQGAFPFGRDCARKKEKEMSYDHKAYELAAAFLEDYYDPVPVTRIQELAQVIQDSIEAWIDGEGLNDRPTVYGKQCPTCGGTDFTREGDVEKCSVCDK